MNRGPGATHTPTRSKGLARTLCRRTCFPQYIDEVVTVSDRDSFLMGGRLTREEGLFCGGSSGTAVEGALAYAREHQLGKDDLVVVLLPDAGEIYLSKMYSDEWMRQNQFLGRSARVGDILESKRRKVPELLSVEMTSTVRDAIATMNRFGVSQLPVFDKGNLVGSLCESALFQRSMETPEVMELTVGSLLEPPFPTVGPDEDVYEVCEAPQVFRGCSDQRHGEVPGNCARDSMSWGTWAGSPDGTEEERRPFHAIRHAYHPGRTESPNPPPGRSLFRSFRPALSRRARPASIKGTTTRGPTIRRVRRSRRPSRAWRRPNTASPFPPVWARRPPRCCFSSRGITSSPRATSMAAPIGFSARCCKTSGSHFPSLKPPTSERSSAP